jgi:hypothetical protein
MALMELLRLPTEDDLANDPMDVELHSFVEAFNRNAVSPFVAKVKNKGHCVELDGWTITNADWFRVVDQ